MRTSGLCYLFAKFYAAVRWSGRERVPQAARRRMISVRRWVEDEIDAASFLGIDDGVGGAPSRRLSAALVEALFHAPWRDIDEMHFTLKVAAIVHII